MRIILIAVIIVLMLYAAGSLFLGLFFTHIKPQTLEEAKTWQKNHYDISFYDALDTEEYTVTSYDGYIIHAVFCRNPKPSNRYIILSHGYTDNRYGDLKYLPIYLRQGFHCILYDLRGHGLNERTYCTYSIRESRDLDALISDTRKRYGEDILLGLHGESLGAATSMAVLGIRQDLAFVVADCPFADIEGVLKGGMKAAHIPTFLLYGASLVSRLFRGYFLGQMRPIDQVSRNIVPVLFMHGKEDTFITPDNSRRLAAAMPARTQIHLTPGAGHAESVLVDPKGYEATVDAFLDTIIT
jgi:pimeloyl-ACP methyl ester carboxylesterase